jgi:NAD(P)H-dependent flavin oxidoreductase YrpB (nitropropane dioxygenase family)
MLINIEKHVKGKSLPFRLEFATDTILVMRSIDATHRVWINAAAIKCAEIESTECEFSDVIDIVAGEKSRRMYDKGDLEAGIVSCGQGVGLIHDIPTVKEVFDQMIEQASGVVNRLC